MKATGEMQHWNVGGGSRPGGGSIIGLPVLVDDAGDEFVYYKRPDAREASLTHIDEVPHAKAHKVKMGDSGPVPKRVPVVAATPQVPDIPAFAQVHGVADMIHPDSPVLKEKA